MTSSVLGIMSAVVAACSDWNGDYLRALQNYAFGDAFVCIYWDAVGQLATGLLVWGAISTAIYITTGSIIIPYILLLLLGGAVLTQVAGVGITVAGVILLGVLGAVPTYLIYRYSP